MQLQFFSSYDLVQPYTPPAHDFGPPGKRKEMTKEVYTVPIDQYPLTTILHLIDCYVPKGSVFFFFLKPFFKKKKNTKRQNIYLVYILS